MKIKNIIYLFLLFSSLSWSGEYVTKAMIMLYRAAASAAALAYAAPLTSPNNEIPYYPNSNNGIPVDVKLGPIDVKLSALEFDPLNIAVITCTAAIVTGTLGVAAYGITKATKALMNCASRRFLPQYNNNINNSDSGN